MNMKQLELFDEQLQNKVKHMQKTVYRFQKQLSFLLNVVEIRQQVEKNKKGTTEQMELWGA